MYMLKRAKKSLVFIMSLVLLCSVGLSSVSAADNPPVNYPLQSGQQYYWPQGGLMHSFSVHGGGSSSMIPVSAKFLNREQALVLHYVKSQQDPAAVLNTITHAALTGVVGWAIPASLGIGNPAFTVTIGWLSALVDWGYLTIDTVRFDTAFNNSGGKGVLVTRYFVTDPRLGLPLGAYDLYDSWTPGYCVVPTGFDALFTGNI